MEEDRCKLRDGDGMERIPKKTAESELMEFARNLKNLSERSIQPISNEDGMQVRKGVGGYLFQFLVQNLEKKKVEKQVIFFKNPSPETHRIDGTAVEKGAYAIRLRYFQVFQNLSIWQQIPLIFTELQKNHQLWMLKQCFGKGTGAEKKIISNFP